MILHSGHGIRECFPLPHAITRMDLAASDGTSYLLGESGISFHTSSEMITISLIEEKGCDYKQEKMDHQHVLMRVEFYVQQIMKMVVQLNVIMIHMQVYLIQNI